MQEDSDFERFHVGQARKVRQYLAMWVVIIVIFPNVIRGECIQPEFDLHRISGRICVRDPITRQVNRSPGQIRATLYHYDEDTANLTKSQSLMVDEAGFFSCSTKTKGCYKLIVEQSDTGASFAVSLKITSKNKKKDQLLFIVLMAERLECKGSALLATRSQINHILLGEIPNSLKVSLR